MLASTTLREVIEVIELIQAVQPPTREYRRRGGRPPLNVEFVAVCDAVYEARNGSGESVTAVAARFGVSRGWICKWIYPALADPANQGLW